MSVDSIPGASNIISSMPGVLKGDIHDVPLLRITASYKDHQNSPDFFVIYLNENASVEFDSEFDALKMYNSDFNVPNIYSVTPCGVKLSINALPYTSEADFIVPVGLRVTRNGIVVFRLMRFAGQPIGYEGIYLR